MPANSTAPKSFRAGSIISQTKISQRIFAFIGGVLLALLLLASGFLVCVIPGLTTALASHVDVPNGHTAFSTTDLANVAEATRDYSFAGHDKDALIRAIYEANVNGNAAAAEAGITLTNAPSLDSVDASDTRQIQRALESASERFTFSDEAILHLDDVYAVASFAYRLIGGVAALFVVCLFVIRNKRLMGRMLTRSATALLAAFAAIGIWAAIDFNGMFSVFHQLFFSQGNWSFPYDSLLICSLPTAFWMGMGAIWLVTTGITSILSILVGRALLKRDASATI